MLGLPRRTKHNQQLAPLSLSPAVHSLPGRKKLPSVQSVRVKKKVEALGAYVIETDCYDVVDRALQTLLVERPAAALPRLVDLAREAEAAVAHERALSMLEQGKLLSDEDKRVLRGGGKPSPVDDATVALLALPEPRNDHGPIGGALQRRGWSEYLERQQIQAPLEQMMRDLLQQQPSSPLSFVARFLEAALERRAAAAVAERAIKQAAAERAAAERAAAERAAAQVAIEEPDDDGEVGFFAEMQMHAGVSETEYSLGGGAARPCTSPTPGGRQLSAIEAAMGRPCTSPTPGDRGSLPTSVLDGLDEESGVDGEDDELARKLRLGMMLSEEDKDELRRRADAEDTEEDPLERKLRLGMMLSEEDKEELRRRATEEAEDPLERKLRLGMMLSEEDKEELRRRAAEPEDAEEDALERKLRLGMMLSDKDKDELRRRAAEAEEDPLERKLRLGMMLSEEDKVELRRRAALAE